jgi:predicted dehydrogenase
MKGEIGLAVVGCGTVGRIRAVLARHYPAVRWIGLCDIKENLARRLAEDIDADFVTTDYRELIKRPEVNAVMVCTDENYHTGPTLAAIEKGHALFIEKPLATDIKESYHVLTEIQKSGVDAVVGYSNRFRRRFLAIKERINNGQIGNVHSVVTRVFMNRMVPIATTRRTDQRKNLTPMVVSGTHSLDISMWLMEGKTPVSVYSRSVEKVLKKYGTKDSTFGVITMDDGTIFSMNISWALPEVWPGAVYGIEIGIVGEKGAIDVEDTHRDLILASEIPQGAGYKPEGFEPEFKRYVDFLTSYPPGDMYQQQIWGPMREETYSWFARIITGMKTPHASAEDGHRNLMLSMAMDLSARREEPIQLPLSLDEFYK